MLSGEDRLKLTKLKDLCTNLQKKVLDLEKAKTAQDSEIASLKKRVKKLERRNKSRTLGLKRLRKVGSARRLDSSDEDSLDDQEDAYKQGRKIADIDADAEDKGKAKMTEPEKPLKKKDQIMYDQEDNTQAMMDADRLLAKRLQAREQEELTDEENASLFVELLEKRKKHFASLRAQEKRNKLPTKAQKKSTMSNYLKHMAGYKQSQLKNKSFAEIQKLFDKAMTRVNMFVDMETQLVKESSKKAEAEMA
ncbi:hypothetical protein Tco_1150578 [Tanacetum coccineum]